MVVAIGHELDGDPPLSVSGDLYETRIENWSRGAKTLDFLKHNLQAVYRNYNFDGLLLIGHSNGGDISSWLTNEGINYIHSVITLDHRRVPVPREENVNVLTIRGGDFPADEGVLPSKGESTQYNICVKKIPGSRHNDMSDYGPKPLKDKIANIVVNYLKGKSCD